MQLDPALRQLVLAYPPRAAGGAPAPEVPVLARLAGGADAGAVPGLRVVARFGPVVTGRVAADCLEAVRAHPRVLSLKAGRRVHAALERSVPEVLAAAPGAAPVELAETGRGVVLGFVDWGCDVTHANLRDAHGRTRLLALWDQRGHAGGGPAPFGYGREHLRADIDRALATEDPLAALGYDLEAADGGDGTHGTHVVDIAAGSGRAPGAARGLAPGADLVFVHLKASDVPRELNLGDSVRLLEGVRYVLDAAGARPVVVNVSLGQHGGPHDGSTLVEQALDAALQERPGRAVVMSTGNYYAADVHASGRAGPGEVRALAWEVPPGRGEAAELELWYAGTDVLHVELCAPGGARVAAAALGEEAHADGPLGRVASLHHRRADPNNGDHHVDVFLHPSAEAGTWTLRVRGVRGLGLFHAWVERAALGAQSRLAAPHVTRVTTTNTICNGRGPLVVGAYTRAGGAAVLLPFSSAGPTRDGRARPHLVAPGGAIRAARSAHRVQGRWVRDALTTKSGTSMAAPHVAGALALVFEAAWPRLLSAGEACALLRATARPLPVRDAFDALRCGAGLLDARAAVLAARALRPLSAAPTPKEHAMPQLQTNVSSPGLDPGVFAATEAAAYTRKSAADPTLNRAAIVAALRELNRVGRWGPIVTEHPRLWDVIHGTTSRSDDPRVRALAMERFLPWHRWYVYRFEQELRAVARTLPGVNAADVFVPYWDWTRDPVPTWVPEVEPLLHALGPGQAMNVVRGSGAGPFPSAAEVRGVVVPARFVEFSERLEDLHNGVHAQLGGTMGGGSSPADFLFFLHHCQVDRIWWTWQRRIDRALAPLGLVGVAARPLFRPALSGTAAVIGTRRVGTSTVNVTAADVEDVTTGALGFDYDAPAVPLS